MKRAKVIETHFVDPGQIFIIESHMLLFSAFAGGMAEQLRDGKHFPTKIFACNPADTEYMREALKEAGWLVE